MSTHRQHINTLYMCVFFPDMCPNMYLASGVLAVFVLFFGERWVDCQPKSMISKSSPAFLCHCGLGGSEGLGGQSCKADQVLWQSRPLENPPPPKTEQRLPGLRKPTTYVGHMSGINTHIFRVLPKLGSFACGVQPVWVILHVVACTCVSQRAYVCVFAFLQKEAHFLAQSA